MSTLKPYFESEEQYECFSKAFWEFFDSQTREFRLQYQEHHSDLAELYFYNKVWRNRPCPD